MDLTLLIQTYPKISIIAIAAIVTFLSTLVYKYSVNQDRMRELKQVQKDCQLKLKEVKGDKNKELELQKKMLECSAEIMKSSFKPMLITMIPFFILIAWIGNVFGSTAIAKSWFWYYLIAGIVFNLFFRKILKVH